MIPEQILSQIDTSKECWECPGGRTNGYGQLRWSGKIDYGHRWMYRWEVGPIPEGYVVHHKCGNRGCIRPSHLEAMLRGMNVSVGPGNGLKNVTHCVRGHEYTVENTMWSMVDGHWRRNCRECHKDDNKLYRLRKKYVGG